jgi:hypothetical protein
MIKMIHNITPTQQFMKKRVLSPDSRCFFCNKDKETIPHILLCTYRKENRIEIFYNKAFKKLKSKSEDGKEKISNIITTMITGPKDTKTKKTQNSIKEPVV